ncbi:MAG: restriction endonuclease subunit S [Paludibacteraceae bacterium]|nr:restriction endonuclease subunit S [Paludibacteraceae bacterium]
MSEWKITTLGNLCDKIGSGATPTGGNSAYCDEGISLIRSQNVLDFSFSEEGLAHINESQAKKLNNVVVEKNDVLLNITGDSVARACVVPKEFLPARVNQHVAIIRPKQEVFDYAFCLYLLQKEKNRLLSLASTGGTRNALTKKMLEEFSFKIPSLPTQRRIAAILSSLDAKIENNNKVNAKLEEIAQNLFKEWFVDFGPFKDGKFVDSEFGPIPEGWRVGTLGEITDSTLAGDWGKECEEGNFTTKVACIRGADIEDVKVGSKGKMPTRYILPKNFNSKHLEANNLVVEISGGSPTQSTGRICLISESLLSRYNNAIVCTNFCRALKPVPEYTMFLFKIWQYLYELGVMFLYENGTTGIKNLAINDLLEKELVIVPPKDVAMNFNKQIDLFERIIQRNGLENEKLATLRDTLLPKLMSGEIEV